MLLDLRSTRRSAANGGGGAGRTAAQRPADPAAGGRRDGWRLAVDGGVDSDSGEAARFGLGSRGGGGWGGAARACCAGGGGGERSRSPVGRPPASASTALALLPLSLGEPAPVSLVFLFRLDVGEGKEINLERCPRSKLLSQCIKYLGPKEREDYAAVIEDGKFMFKNSRQILDTSGGPRDAKWIFVLRTSKNVYVGQKKKGTFQHSSFLTGGATSSAIC